MNWFLRDEKIYIGPMNDIQLDALVAQIPNSGIACCASKGTVKTYLTTPVGSVPRKELDAILFAGRYR